MFQTLYTAFAGWARQMKLIISNGMDTFGPNEYTFCLILTIAFGVVLLRGRN